MADGAYVVSTVKYLMPDDEPPVMMMREPGPGETRKRFQWDRREVSIHDIRGREKDFTLDGDGFAVIDIDFDAPPLQDGQTVLTSYYEIVCSLLNAELGASKVIAFDHNFRSADAQYDTVADRPANFIHNDYTARSAPQRVRLLLDDAEAEQRLKKRYAFINFWRPINHPAEDLPLAICRARSMGADDFVTCAMLWPDREGETFMFHHAPEHEWFYLSRMEPNRALLLKCFDSADDGRARYAPHTAFTDPSARPGAKPRESVEVRTVAFFD